MEQLENVPAMCLNETQELLGVNILKPAVHAAVRAAKPRWHSLEREQVIASCSELASKDQPKVSQDSQSLSLVLQSKQARRGTRSDKASASEQWILEVDQSHLQVLAKNFLLEV